MDAQTWGQQVVTGRQVLLQALGAAAESRRAAMPVFCLLAPNRWPEPPLCPCDAVVGAKPSPKPNSCALFAHASFQQPTCMLWRPAQCPLGPLPRSLGPKPWLQITMFTVDDQQAPLLCFCLQCPAQSSSKSGSPASSAPAPQRVSLGHCARRCAMAAGSAQQGQRGLTVHVACVQAKAGRGQAAHAPPAASSQAWRAAHPWPPPWRG